MMLPTSLSILVNKMLRNVPMDLLALMDKMLTIQHVDLVMNKTV